MPIYEYKCKICQHRFDLNTRISQMDEALKDPCPSCNAFHVERLFPSTAPSIGDSVRLGIRRPDESWKDVLKRIDSTVPGSIIGESSRYI